jgi:type VI secretion system protein ImpK
MEQVADAVVFFEKEIRSAGIPEQQANTAKYILCATADDIVQNIPTEDRHVWTQYSMLSRFFGERIGGVRFFEELDKALKDPLINYPLLELQHTCLALGFQGVHRSSPNGQAQLQQIQRNLYETLRRVRPKVAHDLSPRWKGQKLASVASRFRVPLWVVASVVGALLVALYITLLTLLSGGSDVIAASAATLHPTDKIEIARRVIAPPPPPPPPPVNAQLPRIRRELSDECITVSQSGSVIIIRLCDLALFESGKAEVRNAFKPAAARIARLLDQESGFIKVVGHTDNVPIKSVRFPSNWHLSVERAKAVAELLKQGISRPDRLQVDGKGAEVSIDSNATPDGRSKNRRVEILIPRID